MPSREEQFLQSVANHEKDIRIYQGGEVPIEYLDIGDKNAPPVVLVHSLIANCRQFFPHVDRLSKKYRLICPTLRGHGQSGQPDPENPGAYTPDKMGEDIVALLDHLGVDKFHYIGNSIGGIIGYAILRRHGSRFLSMTTFGSPARTHFPRFLAWGFTRVIYGLTKIMGAERYGKFAALQACTTTQARNFLVADFARFVRWEITKFAMVNICDLNNLDLLENAPFPFLIIYAEKDMGFHSLLKSTVQAAAKNPIAQVWHLAGAGHIANLDRPGEWEDMVEKWLDAV